MAIMILGPWIYIINISQIVVAAATCKNFNNAKKEIPVIYYRQDFLVPLTICKPPLPNTSGPF